MAGISPYEIEFLPTAAKELSSLPERARKQIADAIEKLSVDPLQRGVEKLKGKKRGEPDSYRFRSGDYRILYRIQKNELLVLVIRIGHRREIYR